MTNKLKILPFLLILLSFEVFPQNLVTVNYDEADEIISNPERGFSTQISSPVSGSLINSLKQENITLIQKLYVIPQFNNSELSTDFLNNFKSDLVAAREGGVKLIIRFSYTEEQNGEDAPLNIILKHIEQIKPILQNNYDVIAYMEAGFIGAWGEWYYSTHNLNNTNDRRTVLFALLDALPKQRCVVIRTPDYKRKIFNDNNPISLAEAFNGSKKSRTGAHNDCFLANATDFGTYLQNQIEEDKNYLHQDNMFVPQGGETCNPSEYSTCENALEDLERLHWSVLNKDYNETVLNGWKSNGCYDDIQKKLGYRFVLLNGEFSDKVKPNGEIDIELKIANKGYASPYNKRNIEFILRKTDKTKQYRLITNEDARYWFSGDTVNFKITAGIPTTVEEGEYELLLQLADSEIALHDRSEYSIQLANENLWEEKTGFNSLNHMVSISNTVTGNNYTGDLFFKPDTINSTIPASIIIDGNFEDWQSVLQIDIGANSEETGDALNPSTDIVDAWITDDERKLYISYSLDSTFSEQYFYHVFFDTDADTSTGFHSEESFAGIDLMIENDQMWKYTGTNGEWSWENYGNFNAAIGSDSNNNRIEISISKDFLKSLGANDKISILFNVNDNNETIEDDYSPNNYKETNFTYSYLVTSVEKNQNKKITNKYKIDAYPNPFNNSVTFNFNVKIKNIKSLNIYNVLGQLVKTYKTFDLNSENMIWNGTDNNGITQTSGVYIIQLQTVSNIITKKIVLLK